MKKALFAICLIVFSFGCKENVQPKSTVKAVGKAEVNELRMEVDAPLNHLVFLKVKPDVDLGELATEVEKLSAIPEVKKLTVGKFKDLGDVRAMSEFQLAFLVSFEDLAAYERYQNHQIHLDLKEALEGKLAGPPVTYDFMQ